MNITVRLFETISFLGAIPFMCVPPAEPKASAGGMFYDILTAHRAICAYRRYFSRKSYRPQSRWCLQAVPFKKFLPPTEPLAPTGGTFQDILTAHRAICAYRRYFSRKSYRPQSRWCLQAVPFKKFLPPTEPLAPTGGTFQDILTAHRAVGAYRRYLSRYSYRPQSCRCLWAVCFNIIRCNGSEYY